MPRPRVPTVPRGALVPRGSRRLLVAGRCVSSDRLVVSARSGEVGDAEVEIPIEGPAQGLEIGFNPAYLIDGLKVMEITPDGALFSYRGESFLNRFK